jgi:hypothetical protein
MSTPNTEGSEKYCSDALACDRTIDVDGLVVKSNYQTLKQVLLKYLWCSKLDR